MDIFGDETFNKYLYAVRNHNYQITMKRPIIFVTILLLCTSCSNYRTELKDVESYINERPDSALQVLQSIDVSSLKCKLTYNHYHLLLAQAKDKCFIDETDDSLMLRVVDYYKTRNDFNKLFRSYYYLGRIQQNDSRYSDAMYSYTEAEQLLNHIDDDYAKGLLYAQLGALNHSCLDFEKGLNAFQTAYLYYDKAGKEAHKYYTNLDIGNVCYKLKQYSQAEKSFLKVLSWAADNEDWILYQDTIELLCLVYKATNDISSINEILNNEYLKQLDETLIINMTRAYDAALNADYSGAYKIVEYSWELPKNSTDTCMLYHMSYIINKEQGDYEDALSSYESLFALQDSLVRNALQKPLQSVQRDYFKARSAYNELLLKNNRCRLYVVVIMAFAVILFLVLLFRSRIKRKETEICAYMELSDELKSTLSITQSELFVASSEKEQQDLLLKEMSEQIAILFSKQYELLDKLGNTYYETHGSHRDKEAIYHQVKAEIENFATNKKSLIQLERIVNRYKDNVMVTVRSEMNELHEMDYRLLCFLLAGFSAKAISVFTGDSTANIYMKKVRLKNKISKLPPETSQGILSKLT